MSNRIYEPDFDYPVSESYTRTEDWIEFLDLRIATRIVWLCQWSRFCRDCDCREIIQSCGVEVSQDGYVERSKLRELRRALEEKFPD